MKRIFHPVNLACGAPGAKVDHLRLIAAEMEHGRLP